MVTFNRNQGIYLTALCLSFCLLSCGRKSSRVSQQPALDNKKNVGLLESKDTNIKKSTDTDTKTETEIAITTENVNLEGAILSESGDFKVLMQWQIPLLAGGSGNNQVQLLFFSKENLPINQVSISEFHPRMPMMGHGTDESTQVVIYDPLKKNQAVVSGIFFNMPGEATTWVLTLIVTIDAKLEKFELPLPEVI